MPLENEQVDDSSLDLDLTPGDNGPEGHAGVEPKGNGAAQPDLAKALSDLSEGIKTLRTPTAPAAKQEPEMTEEQKMEYWGVYDPEKENKNFFREFLRLNPDMDPEEAKRAIDAFKPLLASFQKGVARQALIASMRVLDQRLKERDEKNQPIHEYVSQSRARELRGRFNEGYPVLADKKYDKIVGIVAKSLEGQTFPGGEPEFFKTLAEGVAEHIRTIDESFDLGAEAKTKPTAGTAPRLPRGGAGGGGGAGGRQTSGQVSRSTDFAADVLD